MLWFIISIRKLFFTIQIVSVILLVEFFPIYIIYTLFTNGVCVMSKNNNRNMPDNDPAGEVISWVIVFIVMIAFWPVGLFLLFRKLSGYAKPARNAARYENWQANNSAYHSSAQRTAAQQTAAQQATAQQAATQQAAAQQAAAQQAAARQTARDAAAARQAGAAARQAASQAASHAAGAMRGTGDTMRQAANEAKTAARNAGVAARHTASQYTGYAKQAMSDNYSELAREFFEPQKKKSKKRKDRTSLEKKSGKFVSVILLLISIPLFIIGAVNLASAAQGFLGDGSNNWFDLSMGIFFMTGALISFFSRNVAVRRFTRYKNYYAYTIGRGIVPIKDMARAAGVSVRTTTSDIQAMISDGYFGPGAYYDSELHSLVLSPEAAKEARQNARAPGSAYEAPPPPVDMPVNPYMAIIIELRELNATIADIPISDKIDRIEETTAKIFRIVEENPEKQPQIRRFMNYYLPTTLKLLRSYATLEKQGIKGENITSAKENIGRILDTLATGFEQQLDQLFRADAIDIAADITVLENLMQQDGLTGDKPELKPMEGSTW